jgi:alanine dehydrogenase
MAYIGGTLEQMRRLPPKAEFAGRQLPTFADLAAGATSGRTQRDQITFYRNQGNQGLQFSSVGGWVYAEARRRNVGSEIPTDWLLQDVRD